MFKLLFISFFSLLLVTGCGSSSSSNIENRLLVSAQISPAEPISPAQNIVLNFSTDIDYNSVNNSSVYILNNETNESVGTSFTLGEPSYKRMLITPYRYFEAEGTFTIVVTTDVRGKDGSSLDENYTLEFSTLRYDRVDTLAPSIKAINPKDGYSDTLTDTNIVIEFTEMISSAPQDVLNSYFSVTHSHPESATLYIIDGEVEVFNSLMIFKPYASLPSGANISVDFDGRVEDMYGNGALHTKSFSFQTRPYSALPKSELGFKSLSQTTLGKSANAVVKVENRDSLSTIAIGTESSVELYDINYRATSGFPELVYRGSLTLPSSVLSIESSMGKYLFAGTMSSGLYLLEVNTTAGTIIEKEHLITDKSVYGVNLASSSDRIYAVGPHFGLQIFDFNTTTGSIHLNREVNSSIVGTALDVRDITDSSSTRRIYVADYNGSIISLDENGSFLLKTDVNGSVKKLAIKESSYEGSLNLVAACSSGNRQGMDFNGTLISGSMSLLGNLYDVTSYLDGMYETSSSNYLYYSLGDKGIEVVSDDYTQQLIATSGEVVATEMISFSPSAYSSPSYYLVALNSDGKVELFNGLYHDTNPQVRYSNPSEGYEVPVDSVIELSIDEKYLNYATLIKENFTIQDYNTSNFIEFSLDTSSSTSWTAVLTPDANLSHGHKYIVVIKSEISDQLGHKLAGGVDHNISFTTNAE